MTYLFLIIGMSIINALVEFNVAAWFGLLIANFIILSTATIMEIYKPKNYVLKRALTFSPSSYAVMNNNKDLLNEIREKTGINVLRVEISKINEAKDEVSVWIYFRENNESLKAIEEGALEHISDEEKSSYWDSSTSSSSF